MILAEPSIRRIAYTLARSLVRGAILGYSVTRVAVWILVQVADRGE
jgi:hypothetical protein